MQRFVHYNFFYAHVKKKKKKKLGRKLKTELYFIFLVTFSFPVEHLLFCLKDYQKSCELWLSPLHSIWRVSVDLETLAGLRGWLSVSPVKKENLAKILMSRREISKGKNSGRKGKRGPV